MQVTLAPEPPAERGEPLRPSLEARVLAATRDCLAATGLRGTTVDEIAIAAGCGRASIYRLFPGGRRGLLRAMVRAEVDALLAGLVPLVDAADDLGDAVTEVVHTSAVILASHPVLQRALVEDPGAVLPHISFDGAEPLYARVAEWGGAHLARFLAPDEAEAVGEWAARLVLSHLHQPSARLDLTDRTRVVEVVTTYLLPGARRAAPAR